MFTVNRLDNLSNNDMSSHTVTVKMAVWKTT